MIKYLSKKAQVLISYVAGLQPQDVGWVKLNTNENPYPPSPKVAQALQNMDISRLRLYPDSDSRQLCEAIAQNLGIGSEKVFVGNSSDEVLALAFQTFLTGKILAQPDISYGFYPVWSQMYDANIKSVPVREDFSIAVEDYQNEQAVIIANPNAPTSLAINDVEQLVKNNEFVIIDEAYIDFANFSGAISLTKKYDNLLVVRTFSKSYSLAGMRVGFAVGNEKLIEGLNKVKHAFNSYPVDMLAQAVATAAIQDRTYLRQTCNRIIATRNRTTDKLSELGYNVLNSQANFLFVTNVDAKDLYEYLFSNKILVRYWGQPRIKECLRITIGTDKEMEAFIQCVGQK